MQTYLTVEGITLCSGNLASLLKTFHGGVNSLIWCDDEFDRGNPALAITRRSMNRSKEEGGRGFGGALLHQHGVSFTTAPGIACFLKQGTDQTLIGWQQARGVIHEVLFVNGPSDMLKALKKSRRKIYGTDVYGPSFDRYSRVPASMFNDVNRKSSLQKWVGPSLLPVQMEFDAAVERLPRALFDQVSGSGKHDIFLKTDNGEYDGGGVFRVERGSSGVEDFYRKAADKAASLVERFDGINRQIQHGGGRFAELSSHITVQRLIPGPFRSFHIFLDPEHPNIVPVLGITDKITHPLSGRSLGNLNYPLSNEMVAKVGPAIVEMVKGIRRLYPKVFGFFYCDYIEPENEERPIVLIDPGLRPSGNTAACMTALRFSSAGSRVPFIQSDFRFETGKPGMLWSEMAPQLGSICEPEEVYRTGRGILPIGWNPIQGTFRGIVVAPSASEIAVVEQEVLHRTNSRHG